MDAVARPKALGAAVGPQRVEGHAGVCVGALFKEHRRGEHGVGHLYALAKENFDQRCAAGASMVLVKADEDGGHHGAHVILVLAVKLVRINPVGGEPRRGVKHRAGNIGVRAGERASLALSGGRRRPRRRFRRHTRRVRRLVHLVQPRALAVARERSGKGAKRRLELHGRGLGEQLGVKAMVDHVVLLPGQPMALDVLFFAVPRVAKPFERLESARRIVYANAAEHLVDVHQGKGVRRLRQLARPHARAPGEVAAQLPVAHGVVRGVIGFKVAVVGAVVLKIRHKGALAPEQLRLAEPSSAPARAGFIPTGYGPHLAIAIREVVGHLATGFKQRLVLIHVGREMGVAARLLVGDYLVNEGASALDSL